MSVLPASDEDEPLETWYLLALVADGSGGFGIHGLWPEPFQPEFHLEPLDMAALRPLQAELHRFWHSTTKHSDRWLWQHEWEHHGEMMHHLTAARHMHYTQREYFETTLRLYHRAMARGVAWVRAHPCLHKPWGVEYRIPLDAQLRFVD